VTATAKIEAGRFTILAFKCDDAPPGFEAVAHCYERKRDRDGVERLAMLPATKHASDTVTAAAELRAFLLTEIAKEQGRATSLAKRVERAATIKRAASVARRIAA
jgi:hypothetical protein